MDKLRVGKREKQSESEQLYVYIGRASMKGNKRIEYVLFFLVLKRFLKPNHDDDHIY